MKQVYVINLSRKRILLLLGVFLIIFGTSLWSGIKLGRSQSINFPEPNAHFNISDTNIDEVSLDMPPQVDDPLTFHYAPAEKHGDNRLSFPKNAQRGIVKPYTEGAAKPIPPVDLPKLGGGDKLDIQNQDPIAGELEHHLPLSNRSSSRSKKKSSPRKSFYTIQVGAFHHEKDAKSLVSRLKKKDIKAYIRKGVKYYYVRAGKANSKEKLFTRQTQIEQEANVKTLILKKEN